MAVLVSCFALLLPLSSNAQEKKDAVPIQTVLLIGDSLGVGLTSHLKKLFTSQKYRFASHCISGSTSTQWVKIVSKDVEKYKPNLVLVSLGTNDAGSHFDVVKKDPRYSIIVQKIIDQGSKPVWIGLPKFDKKKIKHAVEIQDLIVKTDVQYYDSSKVEFQKSEDGIHATTFGYKSWANLIWNWLLDNKLILKNNNI